MMEFAVSHDGMEEGRGVWVLYVDASGDRFLLCGEDKAFYWKPISECRLLKVAHPEVPRPVIAMPGALQEQPKIAVPNAPIPLNGRRR